jgi:large subunit ribosomal protein L9
MEVILRRDVDGVGHKGDVVDVADGYGRNFLLPRGLALKATAGARAQAESMARSRAVEDAEARDAAQEIATRLVQQTITISAKAAGDEGKLFGSVTPADVVEAVQAQTDIELDRRVIHADEAIKTLGEHTVTAKLHADVEFPVRLDVVAG